MDRAAKVAGPGVCTADGDRGARRVRATQLGLDSGSGSPAPSAGAGPLLCSLRTSIPAGVCSGVRRGRVLPTSGAADSSGAGKSHGSLPSPP